MCQVRSDCKCTWLLIRYAVKLSLLSMLASILKNNLNLWCIMNPIYVCGTCIPSWRSATFSSPMLQKQRGEHAVLWDNTWREGAVHFPPPPQAQGSLGLGHVWSTWVISGGPQIQLRFVLKLSQGTNWGPRVFPSNVFECNLVSIETQL